MRASENIIFNNYRIMAAAIFYINNERIERPMKNSKSVVFKRQQYILKVLKEYKDVQVDDLAQQLKVSPTTIRRDLQIFEGKSIVSRFHGGARLLEGTLKEDPPLDTLSPKNISQKNAIAKYAANLIEDGDTVFMNSSSTTLLLLKYIKDKRVIIVTNNGSAVGTEKDSRVELILTGGEVYERKQSMVGEFALHTLSKITADKAFIGVGGISVKGGITTSVLQETAVNEMMLKRCQGPCYVLATTSKIGREHNFLSGSINKITTIITGKDADRDELLRLKEQGLEIIELDALADTADR
jgi:DeoR/GlpR family transcriptional regulator of sugar metabolism